MLVHEKYSDLEMIQNLKAIAKKLGRNPKTKEFDTISSIATRTYTNRFGSWKESLKRAGLTLTRQQYKNDEIIEELKRLDKINSTAITQSEFLSDSKISFWTIKERYESLDEALKAANLKTIKERYNNFHKQVLLIKYKQVAKKLNRTPSSADLKKYSGFSATFYRNIFGSLSALAKEVGLEENVAGPAKKITDKDLIEELQNFAKKLGRTPRKNETNLKNCKYSVNAYKRAFGTWNNALKAAGFQVTQGRTSTEEFLKEIKRVAKKISKSPSLEEFEKETTLKSFAIRSHFDSWTDAVEKAGLIPSTIPKFTNEEVKEEVKKVFDLFGMVPTWDLFNANSKISAETVKNHFGGKERTWEQTMRNLGYDYTTTYTFINPQPQVGLDGTKYKSKIEAAVANYMFKLQEAGADLGYEYEQQVTSDRKWTCDFYILIGDREIYLEIDGLRAARKQKYTSEDHEKIKYYEENKYDYKIMTHEHSIGKFFKNALKSMKGKAA